MPLCATVSGHGSSPRVRGKRLIVRSQSVSSGLIPACAGKTVQELIGNAFKRAHPRVCGENNVV